eukprot:TRINITY_DN24316_c0_g1_i2.p1 TRINITY_DN24316_c0_g1~~TRINITY_DN24316_c0_g1_i2.p1  ORF type:complete len:299 (-),score=69.39 TRINITY_DN24316_c0_g1_i2:172-1035(-)
MAALWRALREEVSVTINEFREKGAVSTLRDAALDAVDIIKDTGGMIAVTTKTILSGDSLVLHVIAMPEVGSRHQLAMKDGTTTKEVEVLAIDTISDPVRATVLVSDSGERLVVEIQSGASAQEEGALSPQEGALSQGLRVVSELRKEFHETIEDVRSKGAVGVLKDATLDAVDIIQEGAGTACDGARRVAGKAVELLGIQQEEAAAFNPEVDEIYENPILSRPCADAPKSPSKPAAVVPKLSLGQKSAEEFDMSTARGPAANHAGYAAVAPSQMPEPLESDSAVKGS